MNIPEKSSEKSNHQNFIYNQKKMHMTAAKFIFDLSQLLIAEVSWHASDWERVFKS